ncbi:peptidase [Leucothrix sargassi]|nr:peptidase [Leucothrix sargassi]
MLMKSNFGQLFLLLAAVSLAACGGGGSSSNTDDAQDTSGGSNTENTALPVAWTRNVFTDESTFKNRCENPRSGQDTNGDSYEDIAGTSLDEKNWLRSWSNNTYLWYDEIEDQDPSDFGTPQSYFDLLRTFQTTNSGQLRDRFHGWQSTEDYNASASGSAGVGYGVSLSVETTDTRVIRVRYVEPNSPAAAANIKRGTQFIFADGEDVRTSFNTDALINSFFPSEVGEEHTFVVRDNGSTVNRSFVLTSDVITEVPVHNTRVIETDTGKVGYLTFNTFGSFTAEKALYDAFTTLQDEEVSDLVIDLRYNGGGYLLTSAQLGYMVAGSERTENQIFTKLAYNDKHPEFSPITGDPIAVYPFIDLSIGFSVEQGMSLPSVSLDRVFILSSENTCSASESLINGLRGVGVEVVLIGDTTCGKPYGFTPTDNCGTTYFTVQFRGENQSGFGDYADGFSPSNVTGIVGESISGCQVEDDLDQDLGNAQEGLLKAALDYRKTGSCPSVLARPTSDSAYNAELDLLNDPRLIQRKFLKEMTLHTDFNLQ